MKLTVIIGFMICLYGVSACNDTLVKMRNMNTQNEKYDTATFGEGCFWCSEAIFERLNGVISATSGYSGGVTVKPTYQQVCTGETGHAEVVQVVYDPNIITYTELLEVFFKTHDPTTLNQQGDDRGTQYRSIILYHTPEQKNMAEDIIKSLNGEKIWHNPIVTKVEPFGIFYSAEAYHQEYFDNNPKQTYCQLVIMPKVEKFEKLFKARLKK